MQKFSVSGMSCAACSARVEKAVNALADVSYCSVNLLTNSMGVEGTASVARIIQAVEEAGYGARLEETGQAVSVQDLEAATDQESSTLLHRLFWSLLLLLPLLYVSMGHMLWDFPLPDILKTGIRLALLQFVLALAVMTINKKFFINGVRGVLHKAPNMDTLVALGSAASFGWSTYILFGIAQAQAARDLQAVRQGMGDLYFETAAMIVTLITVGKLLEARSKGKTTDALKSLMRLAPQTATVLRDGLEHEVRVDEVSVGDIFLVRPGANIPVDGEVLEGASAINEAALTGESIPVDKTAGDRVSAATTNTSGFLRCRATRVGQDTTLAQIIRLVSDTAASKAPIAKLADRISGIFVPLVIGIACITTVCWLICGEDTSFALARGIAVLVVSCPCALGLATPVAIMVGSGLGARHGILFKTAVALEQAGRTQIVALDKTGTVTQGAPVVTDVEPCPGIQDEELLGAALSLESLSEHPLARAIVERGRSLGLTARHLENFQAVAGNGLMGEENSNVLIGGNQAFVGSRVSLGDELLAQGQDFSRQGKTPIFFAYGQKPLGIIAVADTIKKESAEAIAALKNMGIRVVMLTGDNAQTAKSIGAQACVDEVIADVLPDGKESVIRQLQSKGATAMVGDGINDAPALTRADTGIAIGAGTDVAIDAANIVLVKSRLTDVPAAIRLSRATLINIRQNLFWAFFYNILGIPLAAGVFYPFFGWTLSPIFGAAAMSLSSFCVVSNALRLNFFRPHDASHDHPGPNVVSGTLYDLEPKSLSQKTLLVSGMMCEHCEAHVKEALEALPGVQSACANHKDGTVKISLSADVAESALQSAIKDAGYEYQGIQTPLPVQELVLQVSGMMCEHCEAHVKEALEALPGVQSACANHKDGTVKISLSADVAENALQSAIKDAGYELSRSETLHSQARS